MDLGPSYVSAVAPAGPSERRRVHRLLLTRTRTAAPRAAIAMPIATASANQSHAEFSLAPSTGGSSESPVGKDMTTATNRANVPTRPKKRDGRQLQHPPNADVRACGDGDDAGSGSRDSSATTASFPPRGFVRSLFRFSELRRVRRNLDRLEDGEPHLGAGLTTAGRSRFGISDAG